MVFQSIRYNSFEKNVEEGKPLKQGDRYHKLRKAFSKFYRQHFDLVLFLLYINIKISKIDVKC